jgi:hypothetical protein
MVDRSVEENETEIASNIKTEYGAFFKGNASADEIKKIKRFSEHRSVHLRVKGGETSLIPGSVGMPELNTNYAKEFKEWLKSVAEPGKSYVISIKLKLISDVFDEAKRTAVGQALKLYWPTTVSVESTWNGSTMETWGPQLSLGSPNTPSSPRLRIVLFDRKTLQKKEALLDAPSNSDDALSAFWQNVANTIPVASDNTLLVLATERWPRDPRYFPPPEVKERLQSHGAREKTLKRWQEMTRNVQPCHLAGVSYVLIGGKTKNGGADAFVPGFGEVGKNLTPTAGVTAVLSRDSYGCVSEVNDPEIVEDTKTPLTIIPHGQGADRVLSADSDDRSRVILKRKDMQDPGQFWYMSPLPENRYGLDPLIIINYKTCGCLQGNGPKSKDAETRLVPVPVGAIHDDLLWSEAKWGHWTRFWLLHYHPQNWNLSTIQDEPSGPYDARLNTTTWNQQGMMFWWPPQKAQPVPK